MARVQPLDTLGGSGLWVCAELVKAIKTESAEALKYHFGASTTTVWKWRKAFGVGGHATTKGSKKAIQVAAQLGADAMKAKERTDDELDARAERAKARGQRPVRWTPGRGGWTADEVALLGTDRDEVIAQKIDRSPIAVRTQRVKRKIPAFSGSPEYRRTWTDTELALSGTDHDKVIAEKLGRTPTAVEQKRAFRKVPPFRDRRSR